jgi:hypothetical protein
VVNDGVIEVDYDEEGKYRMIGKPYTIQNISGHHTRVFQDTIPV